jgi:hypothetical protein
MEQIEVRLRREALRALRPAQMTIGLRQVHADRKKLEALSRREREQRAAHSLFPVVRGPQDAYYLLDHHHEARALLETEPDAAVQLGLLRDLSQLDTDAFWVFLDHHNWVHCYDTKGRRRPFKDMPASLAAMPDDPYRSLAADVRDEGGFSKTIEPFLEFLWANHLRDRIPIEKLRERWKDAVARALKIAGSRESEHLPGWCGDR